ncbi:MAG TPA: sensor histidine kinase [Lentibacillus sp.]|uniref:sensor histidine kinase n=1 Tax=Lentibacillus sp. TaxID=1925746 RepID=UPI002B4B07F0|nr:sensor histidine kinase [Lentibacillus sp.]HLR63525.1 sensor histidine kinase [Lentibacillus sp.]
MIKKYLIERCSWLILFIGLQLLTIFIALIDPSITVRPVLYIVFLSTVILVVFVIVRYQKETAFYKQLGDSDYDLTDINKGTSPFEKIVEERLDGQTKQYKNELTQHNIKLEQEKDELLSWIHEVKTPLTAMQLMIERVEDKKVKEQLKYEWLRMYLLLDQQLHQKRILFMENDLYIEQTNLEPLIFQEIKALQSWCIRKGIGFDVSLEIEEVLTDAKWLAFIIRQLLTNAIKYTESADISITSYREQQHTTLAIKDHGRGIDAKDLPRIFDRGFTSTTAHQDTASSGMGLYLVKNALKPLHIKISVQSNVGEGSTFTLTFPNKNEFVAITGM